MKKVLSFIVLVFVVTDSISLEGPPDGSQDSNYIAPVLDVPKVGKLDQSTDSTVDKTGKLFFNDMYDRLIGNADGKSYKGALIKALLYYATFTGQEPKEVAPQTDIFKNIPQWTPNMFAGKGGSYFSMAFEDESYPLMVLGACKHVALQFIRGRTKQLDIHFYQSDTAHQFIPFKDIKKEGVSLTGQLALLDKAMETLEEIMDDAFTAMKSLAGENTAKLQQNYKTIIADYQYNRNHALVNWFYRLAKQLSEIYNEEALQLKNYSFQTIPDAQVLEVYANLFESSLESVMSVSGDVSVGDYVLLAKDPHLDSLPVGVFTDSDKFLQVVKKDVYQWLGVIGNFVGKIEIERANTISEDKQVPPKKEQPVPLYGNYTDVATFESFEKDGEPKPVWWETSLSQSGAPITPFNVSTSKGFSSTQQLFKIVTQWVEDTMRAFAFQNNNYSVWKKGMGKPALAPLGFINLNDDPAIVQKQVLDDFIKEQRNSSKEEVSAEGKKSSGSSTARDIFNALKNAQKGFELASNYYTKSGNGLLAQDTLQKRTILLQVMTHFGKAVQAFLASDSAPKFALEETKTKTQANFLHDAQMEFGLSATALESLGQAELITYTRRLSAQLGIHRYVSAIKGYVGYYKTYFNHYIAFASKAPTFGDITMVDNGTLVTQYQDYLEASFEGFQIMLGEAIKSYRQQLAFFYALNNPYERVNQESIKQLQAALTIFENFKTALGMIHHCEQKKSEKNNDELTEIIHLFAPITEYCDIKNGTVCYGADDYLLEALKNTDSLEETLKYIIYANQSYVLAQPYFEKMDKLFTEYKEVDKEYTPLQDLLEQSDHTLSFKEFFYMHEARLYASVAQKMAFGQGWKACTEGGMLGKITPSSVCVLLCSLSAALYEHGGFHDQATAMRGMVKTILEKNPQLPQKFQQQAGSILTTLMDKKNADASATLMSYKEAIAAYQAAYLLGNSKTVSDYLKVISSDEVGIAQWLGTQPKGIQFPHLLTALYCYEGYLIADKQKIKKSKEFFETAEKALEQFYVQRDALHVTAQLEKNSFEERVVAFKQLLMAEAEAKATRTQVEFMQMFFDKDAFQHLTWKEEVRDIHELFGDLYKQSADNALSLEQNIFAQGKDFSQNTSAIFESIIEKYTRASEYYAEADNQDKFIATQIGITNTVAFREYSAIMPVQQFDIQGVELKKVDHSASSTEVANTIPHLHCTTTITVDDAVKKYKEEVPSYIYRFNIINLEHTKYDKVAHDLAQKDDSSLIAQQILIPWYKEQLSMQAAGKEVVNIESFVTLYAKQLNNLIKNGVTACGHEVKSTLVVQKKKYSDSYNLVARNTPLPSLPRFKGESSSAYQLYNNGSLKLYSDSVIPIHFGDKEYVPANNKAGQDLVKKAILNTYLAAVVPAAVKVKKITEDPLYKKLEGLSGEKRRTEKFTEYSEIYDQLQNDHAVLLGIYDALASFVKTFGQGEGIVDKLQAEAYLEQINIGQAFLLGDSKGQQFKNILGPLVNAKNQVNFYASALTTGYTLSIQAAKNMAIIMQQAARQFLSIKDDPETTAYPKSSDVYPKPVPGFNDFYKWEDAWSYYILAARQIKQYNEENSNHEDAGLQSLLGEIQVESIKVVARLALFHMARFGYNAYTQCQCIHKKKDKNVGDKESAADILKYRYDENGGKQASKVEDWLLTILTKVGVDSRYPKYEYPVVGFYPKVLFKKVDGHQIRVCPTESTSEGTLSPFSFRFTDVEEKGVDEDKKKIVKDNTTGVFQGVAAIQQEQFQLLLKTGIVGGMQSSMQNWETGGGTGAMGNSEKAYELMRTDALKAVYYFVNVNDLAKDVVKISKSELESDAAITVAQGATTAKIIDIFSKKPAFGNQTDPGNRPIIKVQYSEETEAGKKKAEEKEENKDKKKKGDDKDEDGDEPTSVTRFDYIYPWADKDGNSRGVLSLSNPGQLYTHTLQYWISNSVFGHDVLDPLMEWLNKETYSIAADWVNQLQMIARMFYWQVYLPGTEYKSAQNQISTQIKVMSMKQYTQADDYIG